MLLQTSQRHFGPTLSFPNPFVVAAADERADQDPKGCGELFQPVPSPETQRELPALLALLFLNCWCFHGHPRKRRKQQASSKRADAIPEEPSVIHFLLQVTPKMPLNAPAAPGQDPSQLYRKPLHSQLLDAARERPKVQVPRLCETDIAAASTFGPGTAAPGTATALPPSFCFSRGFSDIFQCLLREKRLLLGAALAPQRGRNRSLWQKAPGHPNGSRALFLPWKESLKIIQDQPCKSSCKARLPKSRFAPLLPNPRKAGEPHSCRGAELRVPRGYST